MNILDKCDAQSHNLCLEKHSTNIKLRKCYTNSLPCYVRHENIQNVMYPACNAGSLTSCYEIFIFQSSCTDFVNIFLSSPAKPCSKVAELFTKNRAVILKGEWSIFPQLYLAGLLVAGYCVNNLHSTCK